MQQFSCTDLLLGATFTLQWNPSCCLTEETVRIICSFLSNYVRKDNITQP